MVARERGTAPSALAGVECDVCAFYYDERVYTVARMQQRRWADDDQAERAAEAAETAELAERYAKHRRAAETGVPVGG